MNAILYWCPQRQVVPILNRISDTHSNPTMAAVRHTLSGVIIWILFWSFAFAVVAFGQMINMSVLSCWPKDVSSITFALCALPLLLLKMWGESSFSVIAEGHKWKSVSQSISQSVQNIYTVQYYYNIYTAVGAYHFSCRTNTVANPNHRAQ